MEPTIKTRYRQEKALEEYQTFRYPNTVYKINIPARDPVLKWLVSRGWEVESKNPNRTKLKKDGFANVPMGHAVLYEFEKDLKEPQP